MALENIINAANTTVANFFKEINLAYKTKFAELFPEGTPLAAIWQTLVKVRRGEDAETDYTAEGELDFFPFNFGKNLKDTPLIVKLKIIVKDLPPDSS
ncbi:MAG: hypothetical protein AAGN15_05435 [Cyanobacteria bacterium J06581_3]